MPGLGGGVRGGVDGTRISLATATYLRITLLMLSRCGAGLPRGENEVEKTILRRHEMRFMVMVKASKNSEAGKMPSRELLAEMGKFNDGTL